MALHCTPHWPQLFSSDCRFVHSAFVVLLLPQQFLVPELHVGSPVPQTHFPLLQLSPVLHIVPHAPQFCGSDSRASCSRSCSRRRLCCRTPAPLHWQLPSRQCERRRAGVPACAAVRVVVGEIGARVGTTDWRRVGAGGCAASRSRRSYRFRRSRSGRRCRAVDPQPHFPALQDWTLPSHAMMPQPPQLNAGSVCVSMQPSCSAAGVAAVVHAARRRCSGIRYPTATLAAGDLHAVPHTPQLASSWLTSCSYSGRRSSSSPPVHKVACRPQRRSTSVSLTTVLRPLNIGSDGTRIGEHLSDKPVRRTRVASIAERQWDVAVGWQQR